VRDRKKNESERETRSSAEERSQQVALNTQTHERETTHIIEQELIVATVRERPMIITDGGISARRN